MSNRHRYYREQEEEKTEIRGRVHQPYEYDIRVARNDDESFNDEEARPVLDRHSRRDPIPSHQEEEESRQQSRFVDKTDQQYKSQMDRVASRRIMHLRRVLFGTFGVVVCASVLTCLSTFGCWFLTIRTNFFVRQGLDAFYPYLYGPGDDEFGLGLWSRQSITKRGHCAIWRQDEADALFDSWWRAGRAFSLIASILSIVAVFLALVGMTRRIQCLNVLCVAVCLSFISICQALTFVAYNSHLCRSKARCFTQRGTTYGAVATILYIFLAILYFWLDYKTDVWWEKVDREKEKARRHRQVSHS